MSRRALRDMNFRSSHRPRTFDETIKPISERPVEFFIEGDSEIEKFAEIPRATLARLVYLKDPVYQDDVYRFNRIQLHGSTRLSQRDANALAKDIAVVSNLPLDADLIEAAKSLLPGLERVSGQGNLSILVRAGD